VCCDLKGVEHSLEVPAASLYEVVAQGLRAFRENDWVDELGRGTGRPRSLSGRYDAQEQAAGTARKTRRKSLMERRAKRTADRTGRVVTAHFIAPMTAWP
jgi:hypothetical protein